jgi:hypothetical protein
VTSVPPVTGSLTVVLLVVATLTLGPRPLVPPDLLALEWAATSGPALAAYNLVVGWHCPLETRTGRQVLWPSHLFHAALAAEVIRLLAELATGAVPTGAAAHVGGLAAGVLLCGGLHGRWPARPASRRPLRTRPLPGIPLGT